MRELIACCGLDCEQCDARRATITNDNELKERTAKLWSELNNAPQITADTINCTGCRVEGAKYAFCSDYCPVRQCVTAKGFDTCAECPELESCPKAGAVFQNNPAAKENLLASSVR